MPQPSRSTIRQKHQFGIGSTFKLPTIRYALIGVGSLLLILATVLILQQPGLPG